MQPLISVIVPIYNVEDYLIRCVDSIINQTYKNLEIILVDDGSPDNCPQMCDDYAKCILADPQILANIIKTIIPQFEDMSIEEIIPFGGYMRLQRRWRRIMTQIRSWSSYYRLLNVLRKKLHTDNIRSA